MSSQVYVVRSGETLSGIARRFHVSWRTLAHLNHIQNPNRIMVGTRLQIPVHAPAAVVRPPARTPQPQASPQPSMLDTVIEQSSRLVTQGAHDLMEAARDIAHRVRSIFDADPPSRHAAGPIARSEAPGPRLGDLSMRFETGFHPGQEAQAAAVVSNGVNDAGGVSYGAYQLTSTPSSGQQVRAFLRHEGQRWASEFVGLDPMQRRGAFGDKWREIAVREPQPFFIAQHSFIERTHYSQVVNHVARAATLDINTRSRALQNVVWSMSVQHGRAARLVAAAVHDTGLPAPHETTAYDRRLINALYDVREAYVTAIGLPDLLTRYRSERPEALRQLGD